MCGIAGFAGHSELNDKTLLEALTESLRHRGPDESGFYLQPGIGLGSRRLSIIDLESGTQPIANDRGDVVVFNGEIYNFKRLRGELERKGHRFKTQSDTEVIVHLYQEKGIDFLKDLSGMFAIALWDTKEERLILARDPLGVKPLYYTVIGDRLYFGSELKALRTVPGLHLEIDLSCMDHYLNYLYVPAPRTIYKGVFKLRPGESLTWHQGRMETKTFWRPDAGHLKIGWDEAVRQLNGLLGSVIEDQKVSDVPIGLFLSGGLDSSAIAYYLARGDHPPEAFCTYYSRGGAAFNELEKARQVAKHLHIKLNEVCIRPDVEEILENIISALDEPLADSSVLPTYWTSRAARQSVKVALTGIGGDEVFGGYPRYLGMRMMQKYSKLPESVRKVLSRIAPAIPEQVSSRNVGSWARRFLGSGIKTYPEAYADWMGHLSPEDKQSLYGRELSAAAGSSAALLAFGPGKGDILQQVLKVDLTTYLPEDLLTLADRASMSVGLELRVPLCDQRLVEWMLSLPSSFRVKGGVLKPLLKSLLKDKLPPEILSQKKQGFMVPLGHWFKEELQPFMEGSLAGLAGRGLFRKEGLQSLWQEHLSGRRNRTDVLWALALLEHWFRRYHPDFGRQP